MVVRNRIPSLIVIGSCLALASGNLWAQDTKEPGSESQFFQLEVRGDEICKVGSVLPEPVCYTRPGSGDARKLLFEEGFDLVPRVRAVSQMRFEDTGESAFSPDLLHRVGGALFLRPEDRAMIEKNFSKLSVWKLGFGFSQARLSENEEQVPFVAQVDWRNVVGSVKITHKKDQEVLIEGLIHLPRERGAVVLNLLNTTDVYQFLLRAIEITNVQEDSNEYPDKAVSQILRKLQLNRIYGEELGIGEQTRRFVHEMVAPAVAAEIICIPLLKARKDNSGVRHLRIDREFVEQMLGGWDSK
ncbi:MAG: hypothetical protein C5B49_05345 [Bdellovibrio sp.]|nr:MAG: hypothetical protein C5B49_05345 [Bdellovibrio sp.]